MSKFYICEVESYFCQVQDQSMYKVSNVLQGFPTLEEAEETLNDMNHFHGYSLRVVKRENLHDEFR